MTLDGREAWEGMPGEMWHWRLFNVFARALGLMSVCAGIAFGASSVFYARHPEVHKGVQTLSGNAAVDSGLVGAFCVAIGILFVKVPAYRPDVPRQDKVASRSWWTGEPKSR
jgi:hypothetical protein